MTETHFLMNEKIKKTRIEHDTLGEREVPEGAYYGVQTVRALENFPISGITPFTEFICATALIKKAAALANMDVKKLDEIRGNAIVQAAGEVVGGKWHDHFVVDVFQAGAGTSHNMNTNEVIANRAIELLGGSRGDYSLIHPNDHVNMSQSTNDVFPTAMRIAALFAVGGFPPPLNPLPQGEGRAGENKENENPPLSPFFKGGTHIFPPLEKGGAGGFEGSSSRLSLIQVLQDLVTSLEGKAMQFDGIIKSGRTHLQDAVPIRLGQEFSGYSVSVKKACSEIKYEADKLFELGIGGTAVGTGINTHAEYRQRIIHHLRELTGLNFVGSDNMFASMQSMGAFVSISGKLKLLAIELIRIANDLRLLSSGPRTGLSEIRLPAVQPGSSIMPGKVNPAMPEVLTMVCFQVIGSDTTITLAAQAGQLELNVMMPVINYNLLQSFHLLTNVVKVFTDRCVKGIVADENRCRGFAEKSISLATFLNPVIGYEAAAGLAKESLDSNKTIRELVIEKGILTREEADMLFDYYKMTGDNQA